MFITLLKKKNDLGRLYSYRNKIADGKLRRSSPFEGSGYKIKILANILLLSIMYYFLNTTCNSTLNFEFHLIMINDVNVQLY
jgi:hypothetical protein